MKKDQPPFRSTERWAQFRFSVIGPLLAAPPARGELQPQLKRLAAKQWRHPISGDRGSLRLLDHRALVLQGAGLAAQGRSGGGAAAQDPLRPRPAPGLESPSWAKCWRRNTGSIRVGATSCTPTTWWRWSREQPELGPVPSYRRCCAS